MSHFCCLSLISRLSWVLWAPMLSRSAAVWSPEYFSVSSYEEVRCTGLRWNKRSMQEKITSIVSESVMILGVSVLCQCPWIHVAGSNI